MTASPQKSASRGAQWRSIVACAMVSLTVVSPYTVCAVTVAQPPAPLPVDSAFTALAALEPGKIVVKFDVLPGHYLYRDRFEVQANGQVLSAIMLPKGKVKLDPTFGRVEVYEQPFVLSVATKQTREIELKMTFQGCSEVAGVCYPPATRTFVLAPGAKDVRAKEVAPTSLKQRFKSQASQ